MSEQSLKDVLIAEFLEASNRLDENQWTVRQFVGKALYTGEVPYPCSLAWGGANPFAIQEGITLYNSITGEQVPLYVDAVEANRLLTIRYTYGQQTDVEELTGQFLHQEWEMGGIEIIDPDTIHDPNEKAAYVEALKQYHDITGR